MRRYHLVFGLGRRRQFNRRIVVPICKDADAAKRRSDSPDRVRLLEQLGVHQISNLGIVGVYLLELSIAS